MQEGIVTHILDLIPFEWDETNLLRRARVKPDTRNARELLVLAQEGAALARPKAVYQTAYITHRSADALEIEGIPFKSRVLQVNLQNTFRVFPYIATCGDELQTWADRQDDIVFSFWAELIKEMALRCALHALLEHIHETYQPGEMSSMSPGSLKDWPIDQQQPLFQLLGDSVLAIGVRLTESLLMIPTKTVSGIRFPTSSTFESCQLCPRLDCPGRRAPYQPEDYEERYNLPAPPPLTGE